MACLLLLALALTVSACGDDDEDSATTASGGDTSEATSDSAGIDVPKKKIAYVENVGDESEIAARESKAVRMATEALGWELIYVQAGGDLAKMTQGMSAAINAGVDAVIVASTDAELIKPAFDLAKRKGIPVIGNGGAAAPSDLFTAQYQEDEAQMSKVLTDQLVKDLGGEGAVAVLDNSQLSNGRTREEARKEVLGATEIEEVARTDVDLADLIGGSKAGTAAMLTRNPDVDALWAIYDAMMAPALEALSQRRNTTTKVYSFFANPTNLDLMRQNENVQALADNNLDHTALIAIDQLARFFKDGTEIDPAALEECQLKYAIVTRDDMPPEGEIRFPVEENVQPFLDNREQGKLGEGADCG